MNLQLTHLHSEFDKLHELHGDTNFNSIYGAGCTENPKYVFVFMNPTAKNISSHKSWTGIQAPWIGTKNVWKLFQRVGMLNE
ncbi:hypothetical protein IPJ91_01150 [bacterium]|nr:MAG: hypothetical protein IPJ91_01150 [bacterium]